MDEERQQIDDHLRAVAKDLSVSDPVYTKFRCPICRGYGRVRGKLVGPTISDNEIGKCFYCSGSGVARRRKK